MDITAEEEVKAKEFLKRAEIKTMKKDLQKLREADALVEREKIIKGDTPEEAKIKKELLEKKKREEEVALQEKRKREEVLSKTAEEERSAEKQIKDYADEAERQQIFLFESQRLGLEKQIDVFEKENEPELDLRENQALIKKREWEKKIADVLSQEKKIEDEQNFLEEKEKTSNIPAERKGFEERRGDLEKNRQEIEKKRWALEAELKKVEMILSAIDSDHKKIDAEKNILREKISLIDKSLRDIYSRIISRVEDKKRGKLEEQQKEAAKLAEQAKAKKESIQRQQWLGGEQIPKEKEFMKGVSDKTKERISNSLEAEEEQRKKFLEDIEKQALEEQKNQDKKV